MPRSGGEYRYLARIFHPAVGLLAGWVSVTVGFAAPIALAAMALGKYAALLTGWSETVVAVAALALVTLVHATHLAFGRVFQVVTTAAKIALIVGFIVLGVALGCIWFLVPTYYSFFKLDRADRNYEACWRKQWHWLITPLGAARSPLPASA